MTDIISFFSEPAGRSLIGLCTILIFAPAFLSYTVINHQVTSDNVCFVGPVYDPPSPSPRTQPEAQSSSSSSSSSWWNGLSVQNQEDQGSVRERKPDSLSFLGFDESELGGGSWGEDGGTGLWQREEEEKMEREETLTMLSSMYGTYRSFQGRSYYYVRLPFPLSSSTCRRDWNSDDHTAEWWWRWWQRGTSCGWPSAATIATDLSPRGLRLSQLAWVRGERQRAEDSWHGYHRDYSDRVEGMSMKEEEDASLGMMSLDGFVPLSQMLDPQDKIHTTGVNGDMNGNTMDGTHEMMETSPPDPGSRSRSRRLQPESSSRTSTANTNTNSYTSFTSSPTSIIQWDQASSGLSRWCLQSTFPNSHRRTIKFCTPSVPSIVSDPTVEPFVNELPLSTPPDGIWSAVDDGTDRNSPASPFHSRSNARSSFSSLLTSTWNGLANLYSPDRDADVYDEMDAYASSSSSYSRWLQTEQYRVRVSCHAASPRSIELAAEGRISPGPLDRPDLWGSGLGLGGQGQELGFGQEQDAAASGGVGGNRKLKFQNDMIIGTSTAEGEAATARGTTTTTTTIMKQSTAHATTTSAADPHVVWNLYRLPTTALLGLLQLLLYIKTRWYLWKKDSSVGDAIERWFHGEGVFTSTTIPWVLNWIPCSLDGTATTGSSWNHRSSERKKEEEEEWERRHPMQQRPGSIHTHSILDDERFSMLRSEDGQGEDGDRDCDDGSDVTHDDHDDNNGNGDDERQVLENLAVQYDKIMSYPPGEIGRIAAAPLCHARFSHLIFDLVNLYWIGAALEEDFGSVPFACWNLVAAVLVGVLCLAYVRIRIWWLNRRRRNGATGHVTVGGKDGSRSNAEDISFSSSSSSSAASTLSSPSSNKHHRRHTRRRGTQHPEPSQNSPEERAISALQSKPLVVGYAPVLFAWMVVASAERKVLYPFPWLDVALPTNHVSISLPFSSSSSWSSYPSESSSSILATIPINAAPFLNLLLARFLAPRSTLLSHLVGCAIGWLLIHAGDAWISQFLLRSVLGMPDVLDPLLLLGYLIFIRGAISLPFVSRYFRLLSSSSSSLSSSYNLDYRDHPSTKGDANTQRTALYSYNRLNAGTVGQADRAGGIGITGRNSLTTRPPPVAGLDDLERAAVDMEIDEFFNGWDDDGPGTGGHGTNGAPASSKAAASERRLNVILKILVVLLVKALLLSFAALDSGMVMSQLLLTTLFACGVRSRTIVEDTSSSSSSSSKEGSGVRGSGRATDAIFRCHFLASATTIVADSMTMGAWSVTRVFISSEREAALGTAAVSACMALRLIANFLSLVATSSVLRTTDSSTRLFGVTFEYARTFGSWGFGLLDRSSPPLSSSASMTSLWKQ